MFSVKLKLFAKLFLFILTGMLLLLGLMILAVHLNFKQGLTGYLQKNEQEKLQQLAVQLSIHYQEHNNWESFYNPEAWFIWISHSAIAKNPQNDTAPIPPHHPPLHPPHHLFPPPPFPNKPLGDALWIDIDRLFIFDHQKRKVVGPPAPIDFENEQKMPIVCEGQQVGWLVVKPNALIADPLLVDFMQDQLRGYFWIVSAALLMSLLLAWVMTRQILLPLRRIAMGVRALAAGDFLTQITATGHDELAVLARDFNVLGKTLAQSEQARQQWIADISHELRTPLSVLRGEVEALVDGIRTLTPERIVSLHQEILSLTRLVDDLYLLSLSDLGALDYQFETIALIEQLTTLVESFKQRFAGRSIALSFHHEPDCRVFVNGDRMRLTQLISNLLENSYRYTDEGGLCQVTLTLQLKTLIICIDDSAPSVDAEELPLLFERFHRVDRSRQRKAGGAGLGLAICRNIAEAHSGKIYAMSSELGGVRMIIELPVSII